MGCQYLSFLLSTPLQDTNEQGSQQPKRGFSPQCPQRTKSRGSVHAGNPSPFEKQPVLTSTNFLRPQRAQLPSTVTRTWLLSTQVSSRMEHQAGSTQRQPSPQALVWWWPPAPPQLPHTYPPPEQKQQVCSFQTWPHPPAGPD